MGKGDRKSRKSKIARGTYGKTRPRKWKPNKAKGAPQPTPAAKTPKEPS